MKNKKSIYAISANGYWWCGKLRTWVYAECLLPEYGYSSDKWVKNLKSLNKVINKLPDGVTIQCSKFIIIKRKGIAKRYAIDF